MRLHPRATNTVMPVNRYGHRRALDGLRAFAIIFVLVFHLDQSSGLRGGYFGSDTHCCGLVAGCALASFMSARPRIYATAARRSMAISAGASLGLLSCTGYPEQLPGSLRSSHFCALRCAPFLDLRRRAVPCGHLSARRRVVAIRRTARCGAMECALAAHRGVASGKTRAVRTPQNAYSKRFRVGRFRSSCTHRGQELP